jgi:pimeloyl-ACP methyl ester carboxylesterase
MPPPTRYAKSGDVVIAYQVFGSGPLDLVITTGSISNVELLWDDPGFVHLLGRFAAFARVIIYDKRGTGMSDRVTVGTPEERMDDVRAVMDAAGSTRAVLFGTSEGGPLSILFTATYPARTAALVLYGSFAHLGRTADYPFGPTREELLPLAEAMAAAWGDIDPALLRVYAPSLAADPPRQAWWAKHVRTGTSPSA